MTIEDLIASLHWDELNAKPQRILWTTERMDSRIALVEISGGREVILKQHRAGSDAARSAGTRASFEHDVLLSLRAAMTGDFSVPRPLLVDKPLGVVVLERAVGRALDESVREKKRSEEGVRALVPLLGRAGTWLRVMQQQTRSSEDAAPLLEKIVGRAMSDLESISAHDWLIGRRRKDIAATLQALSKRVRSRVAGHHGDYWPGNVFLDDTRVEVIDFEGYRLGLPCEDVAYFLVQLELLMPRHTRRLPPLRDAFLDAYFENDERDDDALRLFTLTKTLFALSRPPGVTHTLPLRVWLRHMQRRIVFRQI